VGAVAGAAVGLVAPPTAEPDRDGVGVSVSAILAPPFDAPALERAKCGCVVQRMGKLRVRSLFMCTEHLREVQRQIETNTNGSGTP
jgi:hypothetical protein